MHLYPLKTADCHWFICIFTSIWPINKIEKPSNRHGNRQNKQSWYFSGVSLFAVTRNPNCSERVGSDIGLIKRLHRVQPPMLDTSRDDSSFPFSLILRARACLREKPNQKRLHFNQKLKRRRCSSAPQIIFTAKRLIIKVSNETARASDSAGWPADLRGKWFVH